MLPARKSLADQSGYWSRLDGATKETYEQVRIGDPLKPDTLMGPLINRQAVESMQRALKAARKEGGEILCGCDNGT